MHRNYHSMYSVRNIHVTISIETYTPPNPQCQTKPNFPHFSTTSTPISAPPQKERKDIYHSTKIPTEYDHQSHPSHPTHEMLTESRRTPIEQRRSGGPSRLSNQTDLPPGYLDSSTRSVGLYRLRNGRIDSVRPSVWLIFAFFGFILIR